MKACIKCGMQLQDGFLLCPFDGSAVYTDVPGNIHEPRPSSDKKDSAKFRNSRFVPDDDGSLTRKKLIASAAAVALGVVALFCCTHQTNTRASNKSVSIVDSLVLDGKRGEAITLLETLKAKGSIVRAESDALDDLYIDQALEMQKDGKTLECADLLKRIPKKSPDYKKAQTMLSKLD